MRLGIIGLPQSGKTTIFNALTGQDLPTGFAGGGQMEVHTAVVSVPDTRVDFLSSIYNPKKTTYTSVTYKDIGGLDSGMGEGGLSGPLKNELSQVDGFVHVVRVFEDDNIPHPQDSIDPRRDVELFDGEFLLLDMIAVERRIERLKDEWGKKADLRRQNEIETALMARLYSALENETPLREVELTADEHKMVSGYGLMTLKPMMIVFNCGDAVQPPDALYSGEGHDAAHMISLQGQIEAEIAQMDNDDDRTMFLAEYDIAEPSASRVIRLSYDLMGIQSFFTVGEDEVRAWSVPIGADAVQAAGTIHTDLARGFIRAEVTAYDDIHTLGDMKAAKAAGKQRLEGKTYTVQDGDILTIRFNV